MKLMFSLTIGEVKGTPTVVLFATGNGGSPGESIVKQVVETVQNSIQIIKDRGDKLDVIVMDGDP